MDKQYDRIRELGEGGGGKAFLVRDKNTGELYTLKVIPNPGAGLLIMEPSSNSVQKEVAYLATLNHPNIVKYIRSFEDDQNLYILMEYCEAGDLETKIRQKRSNDEDFTEDEITEILTQLANALCYIHAQKIIHRDVTPLNIFLTSKNVVKIGDFGVSTELSGQRPQARSIVGAPGYMCPEILRGDPYDYRSDVWSLGVVIYQLVSRGEDPFEGKSDTDRMSSVLWGRVRPMPPTYSENVRNLILRMLSPDADDRPSFEDILKISWIQDATQRIDDRN